MALQIIYGFEEVREYLGVGRDSMFNILHSGELKGCKIGGKWRIREQDLNEYIANRVETREGIKPRGYWNT